MVLTGSTTDIQTVKLSGQNIVVRRFQLVFCFIFCGGPEKRTNEYQEEVTAQGEVDLSCVFLFEDSSGVHNGCRELVGWENEGIEDTDYKENICYSELALNFILVYLPHRR